MTRVIKRPKHHMQVNLNLTIFLQASKNVTTFYKDGTAQLSIKGVEPSHSGVYTVTASNVDGATSANIELVVKSPPAAPEGPLQASIVGKSCKLSWKPPKDDGHSPLLGFYLEKYDEKTKKWAFVARSKDNNYTIDNVGDATSHRFRVAAENAVGTGSFIESAPITADVPPEIAREAVKTLLVVPEGKDATITLSFKGKPAPSAEWLDSAGKPIKDSKKYKIKTTEVSSELTIKGVGSSDAGQYVLKIKNTSGEDSLPITIQVQGRPDTPGKPTVKQNTADSVVLTWTEPKKDGGSAIQQFTVEMCTAANKKWKKAETTKQATTTLFNLVPGELYIFRVKAANSLGESEFSEESEPFSLKEPKVDEAIQKIADEEVSVPVDYEKFDSEIDPTQQKEIDVRHLPNDLLDKYIICEELGQGAYGTVYRAIEKSTGKIWAAKMVQVRPGVKKEDVLHEISIMNQLHHDKLLNLHEAFDLGNEMCLIEEFVSGGELLDKIIEDDMLMSEDEAKDYMRQILQGLEHMHSNQIVHLDLKVKAWDLSNSLVWYHNKKTVKLLFGTPEFCAPEVVNYEPVGFSTDMWSVGVITYVLLSGLSPFLGDTDEETLANVSAADWGFDDPVFDDVSDAAKDFICRLMCKDKRRRMTVKQALQHPWIVKTPKARKSRGQLTPQQKKKFMALRRWSDDLLPIGRLAKRGAIFRQQSMDGVFERNISFDADYPPHVKKQLEDIVAYVGDLIAALTCEMDGSPLPRITWYKDEKQLEIPSIKYDSQFDDGLAQLTVKNIEQSDAGVYRCRATNELGSVSTEGKLIVGVRESKTSPAELQKRSAAKVAEEPTVVKSKPSFKPGLVDSTVILGEQLILSVTSVPTPELTVEWFHNEEPISENDAQYVQKHVENRYELYVDRATLSDGGKWKVIGRNMLGQCESSCDVIVKVPDGLMAPVFEKALEDISCEEMELLTLPVKILANPPPEITWYCNDKELQHSLNHRLQFDDDTKEYSLTIVKAYAEDSGEYKCLARNSIGEAESVCFVRIEEPEEKRSKKIDESKAPKFSMHLVNPREVPEGTELILTCVVTGTPHPKITWLKDGKRLSLADKDATYDNGVCTLTIPSAVVADSGNYTCEAENINGKARSETVVTVTSSLENDKSAPKFVELLMDQTVQQSEEILLECCFKGKPTPTITWYKDGQKLVVENRMLQYCDRKGVARLNIMNCVLGDSGDYSCEVVNALGKDMTECRVKVTGEIDGAIDHSPSRSSTPSVSYSTDDSRPPVITRPLVDTSVKAGSRELLELEVDGVPTPVIEWYHDGKLVTENRTLRTTFDGKVAVLKIYEAQPEHQGQYICKVSNKLGVVESRAMLVVEQDTTDQVTNIPVFIKKLQNVTVKEVGGPISLSCQVRGDQPITLNWLHNGTLITSDSRYRIRSFDDGISTLEILAITEELCGTYTVRASNPHGDSHSSALVQLDQIADEVAAPSPPTFVIAPKSKIVVDESSSLTIVCDISGSSTMKVTWFKNGRQVNPTDRVRMERDGLTFRLVITNATAEDEGEYTATATDEFGEATAKSEVVVTPRREAAPTTVKIVKKPPSPISGELVVENCTKDSVSFSWNPPEDAQASHLEDYKVEQRTPDQQTWTEVATVTRPRCTIKNLSPNTEYLFRVLARNAEGLSEGSSPFKVRTLPAGSKPQFTELPAPSFDVMEDDELSIVAISRRAVVRRTARKTPWNPPEDAQASHLEDYKVEQRTPDQQTWTEVATVTRPRCTIKNLSPNTEYLFRVLARNAEGLSEGSSPFKSDGIKTGKRWRSQIAASPTDSTSSMLTIAKARSGIDDATYTCQIENEMGQASSDVAVTIIATKEEPELVDAVKDRSDKATAGAPSVAKPLSNETVQLGQQFTLCCRFTGKDGTTKWYHNDDKVSPTGRYELFSSPNGSQKLVCHNSSLTDAGIYRCVFTNDKGMAQTECEAVVKSELDHTAPVFDKQLQDITTLTGKQLVLSCRAVGHPEPDLVWTKDGERIATSRRVRLEFDEQGTSELHIHDCTAQDAGIYLCTATNTCGVESTQCTLTVAEVTGKDAHLVIAEEEKVMVPRFTRAPPSTLDAQEGGQFKLVAKAVGEPKPTLTWKKDGREVLRTNRLYKTYLTGDGESHLVVECVVSKTSGIFSCIAHNIHGEAVSETQVFVHRGKTSLPAAEKPAFSEHLKDTGVVAGHPVTLGCKVHGVPEPELKWYYIDDAGNITCLTDDAHGWIECRGGEAAELKADCVLRSQQGTYKCVASNELGQASSMCYLLIGDLKDERAGPPRFLRCLRDIWTPLGEEVVFEVEVAGYPAPDLTWYHQDKKIVEGKTVKITYLSENVCELRVSQVALKDLGSYAVEASNVHGVVRTTSSLNVGEPRHAEPPQFQQIEEPGIEVKPKVAFREEVKKSASAVRMEFRKKEHRHRHTEQKGARSARMDARGLAASIVAGMKIDEESRRQSTEEQKGSLAMEEIREAIQTRNQRMCRPKFIVKPRPKKVLEEFKSLRLKTAISANPTPIVHWDREGVILETGNKYSIYNDGDFYYLEVHQVSVFDQGFYNCTATNSEGISTCSSEVEVVKTTEDTSMQQEKRKPKKELKAPSFIEVLPGKLKAIACEPLSIECSLSGYPAPAIRWLRNGSPLLPQTERYVMSYDGECATLKFAFVSVADEGVYTCEAKNECGETKAQVCLEIDPGESLSADGIPPLFRTEKVRSIIKANDGERVELVAELVQGSEPLQIRWIRNRVIITDSESFQYVRNGADVRLVIADAFPEDGGEYAVEARNQFGTARCIMRLDIHSHERSLAEDPPRISDAPAIVRIAPGESAELSARVTGHPDPVVAWAKGAEAITNSVKYTLSNEGDIFSLHVNDAVRTDAGKYSLTAVNVAGEATAAIELAVSEPTGSSTMRPRFTHAPVSVQSRLGHRVELLARFTGQPPAVCRWFKGDVGLEDGVGGYTIVDGADNSTLSILFLENEHVGEYLCTVRNTYGEDLASAMIMIEGSSIALPQRRSIQK
ncbi:immunoglobulin I-set domain protein [Cooperia oncophora]